MCLLVRTPGRLRDAYDVPASRRGLRHKIRCASPHMSVLFFSKSKTVKNRQKRMKKQKKMFSSVPWMYCHFLEIVKSPEHDSTFDPDTLLVSSTSFQAPFKVILLFKKRPPMVPNVGSSFNVALRLVSCGVIGSFCGSGVDLGAAWTVSARVKSFFQCFLPK